MKKFGIILIVFVILVSMQMVAAQCVPPPAGIISWWPGDGTPNDIVGTNEGTRFANAGFVPGFIGQAFSFYGSGGIRIPHNESLVPARVTVEAWVMPTAGQPQWARIFQKSFPSGYYYYVSYILAINGGGTLIRPSFGVATGGSVQGTSSPESIPLNSYSHVAGTYDGKFVRVYVNGLLRGTAAISGPIDYDTGDAFIGYNNIYPWENWIGNIDEVSVYSRALSPSDIQRIYGAGPLGKCKTLLILTESLPVGVMGSFSSDRLQAIFGAPPYSWSLLNSSLPAGMTFFPNGVLNGTPTNAGNFTFTLRVTDANNSIAEKTFTKQVFVTLPPPQLRIHKTGTVAVPGRTLDYFIEVTNMGNFPAQNIVIDEYIDTPLFNVTSTNPPAIVYWNESNPINVLSWNISTLAPLETRIFMYRAKLNASTPIGTEVVGPVFVNTRAPPPSRSRGPWQPLPLPPGGYSIGNAGGFKCVRPPILLVPVVIPGIFPPIVFQFVGGQHIAIDLKADPGTDVFAVAPGRVIFADWLGDPTTSFYGYTVIVRHAGDEYSFYSHLNANILVTEGQFIQSGTRIGLTGTSGLGGRVGSVLPGLGPHLHFAYFRATLNGYEGINPCEGLVQVANPERCSCGEGGESSRHIQSATRPIDPNEKEVIANRFIQPDRLLVYPIHFENIGNVSALDVFVTDGLDRNLNFSTMQLLSPNGTFNPQTGLIRWELYGINLEPNATGVVMFSAKPKQGLPSGTAIRNNATIQFEIFENITTNTVENIIDDVSPSCTMRLLPNITASLNFTTSWNGTDPVGEIDRYSIFASIDDGAFNQFASTRQTNATFIGERGRTYKFICIAQDTAGNVEVQAPNAEATTVIPGAHLELIGIPRIGSTINFSASDWAHPGNKYVLALSLGTSPGIPLGDGRIIPLNPDIIFLLSIQAGQLIGLRNNVNFLNEQGLGASYWDIPNVPELNGITVYAAFVVLDHTLPIPFASISNAVPITITQ